MASFLRGLRLLGIAGSGAQPGVPLAVTLSPAEDVAGRASRVVAAQPPPVISEIIENPDKVKALIENIKMGVDLVKAMKKSGAPSGENY